MDQHWNLANKNDKPIDYKQFVTLTSQFKDIAEHEFATPCDMTIRLMNSTKANDNFDMSFALLSSYAEINQEKVTFETHNLYDVSETQWTEAKYIDITVQPVEKDKKGFASAEFKGDLPQAASFYVQHYNNCTLQTIKQSMIVTNKKMLIGDGSATNSCNYGGAVFAHNEAELTRINGRRHLETGPSFVGFILGGLGFSS